MKTFRWMKVAVRNTEHISLFDVSREAPLREYGSVFPVDGQFRPMVLNSDGGCYMTQELMSLNSAMETVEERLRSDGEINRGDQIEYSKWIWDVK